MTIVQVIHSHVLGGVERQVAGLSQSLAERGHRVYLACPGRGWLWDAVQNTAVVPFHVSMDGLADQASVSRLARLVRYVRANVIHAHMPRGTFYAVKAGHRARVPVVASAHAGGTHKHYAGAARVLCISGAVQQNLVRHEVPVEKTRVVYGGVPLPPPRLDPRAIQRLRAEWGVPEGGRAVGMLARLTGEKGADVLLRVAERWKYERPDVRFIVAGTADDETDALLKDMCRHFGLRDTVRFLGLVPDSAEVMAAYDVLAVPSRREYFPVIILEAMALGIPVVANRVDGIPEIVHHGVNGLLAEPDAPDALSAALSEALNPVCARSLIAAGRETVHSRFALERMVSEVEAHYIQLMR